MKKILSLTAVMALMVITSVALVACGKKTMTDGEYIVEKYTVGTTDYVVSTEGAVSLPEGSTATLATYVKLIKVADNKFTTTDTAATAAVVEKEYTLDGEKVMVDDTATEYTFKDDKITRVSGTGDAKVTVVYKKKAA